MSFELNRRLVARRPALSTSVTVDAVTASIINGAFETICFEAATHLGRAASSAIINQSNERNASIIDANGRLAAVSVGIPQLLFVSPLAVRWGLENLNLTQAKLDALGFAGVMRPISTSCTDHMGAAWARIHTWDGKKWNFSSDWYESDSAIIKPMIKAAADKYAAEKKIERRTPADCQS